MANYQIEVKKTARRSLLELPAKAITAISRQIDLLAENPYPDGCKKLSGSDHTYRIRVGDYRIVYTVDNGLLIIEVIKVGHRKDIYR